MIRSFSSLSEQEILALAISLEEEDARIYDDFADGLKENYPDQSGQFKTLRQVEDGHRHRLLDLYRRRFGDHVPLIRRQDVKGRSEEHTSELQSRFGISYAVFCL